MLKEENEFGSISLKHFYIRRALRILPVYVACIILMALVQIAGISAQRGFIWLQLLTFTRNFYQTASPECLLSAHFWSLAVEEQFYLVWPVVFVLLARSLRRRICFLIFMVLLSVACHIIALLGSYNRHLFFLFEENSTFLFLDSIAYGCLGAILLDAKAESLKRFFKKFFIPLFPLSCLLLLIPEFVGLGAGMQSLGYILLLLQSVLAPEFKPFKLLNHPWLVQIGVWSYSLYIWQQLVYVLWPFPKVWFLAFPMTFVVAWISYNFLEKPFFALRSRFRRH